jgi:hypothetical protein
MHLGTHASGSHLMDDLAREAYARRVVNGLACFVLQHRMQLCNFGRRRHQAETWRERLFGVKKKKRRSQNRNRKAHKRRSITTPPLLDGVRIGTLLYAREVSGPRGLTEPLDSTN